MSKKVLEFNTTPISGAWIIQSHRREDHRGSFARMFCQQEFNELGIDFHIVQSNFSFTDRKGTIRGLHYQIDGAEEEKLVTCIKGSFLDVIIDLRCTSGSFGSYFMVELSESNEKSIFVPKGCAHGLLSLQDNSAVIYHSSNFYDPVRERGVRWNDPCFNIDWPLKDPIISEKDANIKDFEK